MESRFRHWIKVVKQGQQQQIYLHRTRHHPRDNCRTCQAVGVSLGQMATRIKLGSGIGQSPRSSH